jgi:hypothetical protein
MDLKNISDLLVKNSEINDYKKAINNLSIEYVSPNCQYFTFKCLPDFNQTQVILNENMNPQHQKEMHGK